MKKIMIALMAVVVAFALTGCSQQNIAKNWGGTYTIDLPEGKELEVVTWKDSDLWILTKDRPDGEEPETHYYYEDSAYGLLEGEIIIHEH